MTMRYLLVVLALAALAIGCGGGQTVTRLDPGGTTDLSGKWNETDARLVAEEMIADALARPWLMNFVEKNGEKPVVTVGTIRNKTNEHIDTEVFTADFERELINSGNVRFVGSHDERYEVREERQDQAEFASEETRKLLHDELGADFILLGAIKTITDAVEGRSTVFYQTDLELINIETNEKVWIGTKKIKKGIAQSGTKW
ncbi:MAG TPA: penicillin-binding protein activator LpoB [candidate division Zixibacteria bacterium]|nr:penicillin-binding protein activator LpoB [candidate division Zixibacteria bacterium]MDD4917548.1 penicillin-binding protein activator LpoB [candidate division Zixibacteria bacterium]MDM7972183.1 penicillin-binding protein activator LpoB [candidate division Zixibacteria bacterium]HOD66479.1 penicillin-binding protein activator LpoB [candidate division Zixibacteria bacterium]HOZ06978.1 penicillin-binding protein activator LpoB [candidate division Zixibacteria bacterium]